MAETDEQTTATQIVQSTGKKMPTLVGYRYWGSFAEEGVFELGIHGERGVHLADGAQSGKATPTKAQHGSVEAEAAGGGKCFDVDGTQGECEDEKEAGARGRAGLS